jgi:competence ComEA-like helix-hairpin-helix protein
VASIAVAQEDGEVLKARELTRIALSVSEASGKAVIRPSKADAKKYDLEGGGHVFRVSTAGNWDVDVNARFLQAAIEKHQKPVLVVITTSPDDLKNLHSARAFCRTFRLGFLHWDAKAPVAAVPAAVPKTNLNTATKEELMALPGIGDSTATQIITERKVKRFDSIDDLTRVRGIGEGKLKDLRDQITTK